MNVMEYIKETIKLLIEENQALKINIIKSNTNWKRCFKKNQYKEKNDERKKNFDMVGLKNER